MSGRPGRSVFDGVVVNLCELAILQRPLQNLPPLLFGLPTALSAWEGLKDELAAEVVEPREIEVLFEQQYYEFLSRRTYDVAPDGRFLVVKEDSTTSPADGAEAQIILVENWFQELTERVPVN